MPEPTDPVAVARRLADEVLFPGALAADEADTLPRERLDALADAGLYGLMGPAWAGGLEGDLDTLCRVTEALASGCLTTTFVWAQHVKTVFVASVSASSLVQGWVEPLCAGRLRSGLALAGALPSPTPLRAVAADGGWRLTGPAPWVSGWGRVDVCHTAGLADDGRVVWLLVDARETASLRTQRVELAALNATATVDVVFEDHFVPDERVTVITPAGDSAGPEPSTLRLHAAFALGVASRCSTLLGPSHLDDELAACRAELARADAATMPDARAAASELAVRAATTLMSASGSSSLRTSQHPQRLAREALFTAVFAARSPVGPAFRSRLGSWSGVG
jgi:alkylation response protein AidB-like acyl-CoA dehydrogenase